MFKELFSGIGKVLLLFWKVVSWIGVKLKYLITTLIDIQKTRKHNTFKDERVDYLVKSSKMDD